MEAIWININYVETLEGDHVMTIQAFPMNYSLVLYFCIFSNNNFLTLEDSY